MVIKKPEWLTAWMDQQKIPPFVENVESRCTSRYLAKTLDEIKTSCHSSDKNLQKKALACWKLWIIEQVDWNDNLVCFQAVEALVVKKFHILHNDSELCLMRLELFHLLINRVCANSCEGPAYVLENLLESCLMWLTCKEMDKEIRYLILKFLCTFFSQAGNCHDPRMFGKLWNCLLGKFCHSCLVLWENVAEYQTDFFSFWTIILELSERCFESISIVSWHEIFRLVRKISCSGHNLSLAFLHSCAVILRSVMNSPKYFDLNHVDTTPSEQLLLSLVDISNKCSRTSDCFLLCKETCQILSTNIFQHRRSAELCACILTKLDDMSCKRCLWGLWTGMAESFEKSTSILEASISMQLYRKLRGVAVNFVLDVTELNATCIKLVKSKIFGLIGCACLLHKQGKCAFDLPLVEQETPSENLQKNLLESLEKHLVVLILQNVKCLKTCGRFLTKSVLDCSANVLHKQKLSRNEGESVEKYFKFDEVWIPTGICDRHVAGTSRLDLFSRKTDLVDFKCCSGKLELQTNRYDFSFKTNVFQSSKLLACNAWQVVSNFSYLISSLQKKSVLGGFTWASQESSRILTYVLYDQLVKRQAVNAIDVFNVFRNYFYHSVDSPNGVYFTYLRSRCADNFKPRTCHKLEMEKVSVEEKKKCRKRKHDLHNEVEQVRSKNVRFNEANDREDKSKFLGKRQVVNNGHMRVTRNTLPYSRIYESRNYTDEKEKKSCNKLVLTANPSGSIEVVDIFKSDLEEEAEICSNFVRHDVNTAALDSTRKLIGCDVVSGSPDGNMVVRNVKHDDKGQKKKCLMESESIQEKWGGVQNRASRMLACIYNSNSPPSNRRVAIPSLTDRREVQRKAVGYSKMGRASRLLALVQEDTVESTTDKKSKFPSVGKIRTTFGSSVVEKLVTSSGLTASKKAIMATPPRKKSIRFDEDRNEMMIFFTDSPPSESSKAFKRNSGKT